MGRPRPRSLLGRSLAWAQGPSARLALVFGLAYVLFVGTDQDGAAFSADTARYALIGREMVERGDWTRLTIDGKPYANKPPLVFWLEAAAFSVLGFTEAAARLPSRIFGLATVALVMALVARRHGRRAAFWAGLITATWHAFQRSAITCRLDTTLTFFTLASIAVFLSMDRRGFSRRGSVILGALIGLAVLTKGIAGLLAVPAIALGAFVAGRRALAFRAAPLAITVLLLVSGPWFLLQAIREGLPWISDLQADLLRVKDAGLADVLSLYGREFFLGALPWLPVAAMGIAAAIGRVRRSRRRSLPEAILLAALLVLGIGISMRSAHHARYFIPAVPILAWLGGAWLAPAIRAHAVERRASVALAALILIAYPFALMAGLFPIRERYADIRRAAELVRDADPRATLLPTWPPEIGEGVLAATRFYFGLSLRPFAPGQPGQPPYVLLRQKRMRTEFEERFHLPLVFEGEMYLVYGVSR